MSLLGCNSKLCWDGIFQQIIDIVSVKKDNNGFIRPSKNEIIKNKELVENGCYW